MQRDFPMTHELILTSVAQGLNPKESGFCPVAADSGISPQVVEYLAALSFYLRPVRASDKTSPATYSHLILPGIAEHVLSQIADAGTDYQNQPNVLAHHIVLKAEESPPEDPAWLFGLPGFHFSEWNELPVQFVQGRAIPTLANPQPLTRRQQIARQSRWLDPQKMALTGVVDTQSETYLAAVRNNGEQIDLAVPPTTPCPVWQELAGDPGWGGVLADTVLTGQPAVLIYEPELNILPLYIEALALLPHHSAWHVTFCTSFAGLPDSIPCQWKGVIAGSDAAKQLIKDPNNLVLDLTAPIGKAPAGKYVDFARHGQERMLPLDAEEYIAAIVNADTKSYDEVSPEEPGALHIPSIKESVPSIRLPRKRAGLLGLFLHRSTRFQFYFLYGIMFVLVLFLLVLAMDQAGNFGIIQRLQNWNQRAAPAPLNDPQQKINSALENEAESEQAKIEPDVPVETENTRSIFENEREKQKEPLLQFLEKFEFPPFLAVNFPDVQNDEIDVPEKKVFEELSPLHPFGSALEIQFIPLFELPDTKVQTLLVADALPDFVWQVESVDNQTDLPTPMFLFQLTETGLEMDWQQEGLNNQYLYGTILSSLGFLQLSVAEEPGPAIQIPLFAPVKTEPMKVSDLAKLPEAEMPEHAVELPFASELWRRIFAELNPPKNVLLEVRAKPADEGIRIESLSASEVRVEVRTTQQAGKPAAGGETVFENLVIPFIAEASLERIVWKGEEYVQRWRLEQESVQCEKEELEKTIEQLRRRAFEGDSGVREEREKREAEWRDRDLRFKEIENILDKLPAAYEEIGQNESVRFPYLVFLESAGGERKLLILTAEPYDDDNPTASVIF